VRAAYQGDGGRKGWDTHLTKVNERAPSVSAWVAEVAPVHDLLKGGKHMRAQGTTYLPKFPMETQADYDARKDSTWLFPGIAKALEDYTGKVFERPVVAVDGGLDEYLDNVDLEGRDLSQWARDFFAKGIEWGMTFGMVDAPPREGEMTRGQAAAAGLRPYLVHIDPKCVLGWKWESINNAPTLTHFRFTEEVADPERGEFSEDTVEQIRALDLVEGRVAVRLYQKAKDKKGEFVEVDSYATDMTEIMIAPFYTGRTGYMAAKPPLLPLAELNLAHWRLQSDKSNCLHKALAPLLFLKQMAEVADDGGAVVNSASYGFAGNAEQSDMKWVEITGAGIDKARDELGDIERQMQHVGLQLVMERVSGASATGDAIEHSKTFTRLAMWADSLKDTLEILLGWMAELGGVDAPSEVQVNTEYDFLSTATMADVLALAKAGVISGHTAIAEAKRRGILAETVTPEDEVEFLEKEGMALNDPDPVTPPQDG
jgi:hypothetical protein